MQAVYEATRSAAQAVFGADNYRWPIASTPAWLNAVILMTNFILPPVALLGEALQLSQLAYSKFAPSAGGLASRVGMLIAYGGGLVFSFLGPHLFSGVDMSQVAASVVVWMVRAHFCRRIFMDTNASAR